MLLCLTTYLITSQQLAIKIVMEMKFALLKLDFSKFSADRWKLKNILQFISY